MGLISIELMTDTSQMNFFKGLTTKLVKVTQKAREEKKLLITNIN